MMQATSTGCSAAAVEHAAHPFTRASTCVRTLQRPPTPPLRAGGQVQEAAWGGPHAEILGGARATVGAGLCRRRSLQVRAPAPKRGGG